MKKLITALILCVSMIVSVSTTAYAAEIEYSPADYYAVVEEINNKYDVTITIESFSEEVTKTPAELYAELEALVLRSKANEAKKTMYLEADNVAALSVAANMLAAETYYGAAY